MDSDRRIITTDSDRRLIVEQNDAGVGVSFSSTLAAVTMFFTGILLTQYATLDPSVNIPILFLILSTFGFLYSTLVFANSSGLIVQSHVNNAERSIQLGNIISEFIGVYFLILAIPLIINVISKNSFLRYATEISDLAGLIIYHISGFTIMHRYFKKSHYFFLLSIISIEVFIFLSQFKNTFVFELFSTLLIMFLSGITIYLCWRKLPKAITLLEENCKTTPGEK